MRQNSVLIYILFVKYKGVFSRHAIGNMEHFGVTRTFQLAEMKVMAGNARIIGPNAVQRISRLRTDCIPDFGCMIGTFRIQTFWQIGQKESIMRYESIEIV